MYEAYFGLREPAFALAPDPRFFWLSPTHQEGLSVLEYGITGRKGILLVTGEIGAGKTVLLRTLLQRLPPEYEAAVITNTTHLVPLDLLKHVTAGLGIEARFESKADYVIAISSHLRDRVRTGSHVVLIVDEAQNLDPVLLEEVRLLSNLEAEVEQALTVVLTGQPEFRGMLAEPSLRSLQQRIVIRHHVEPLHPGEVLPYLSHRIRVAGGSTEAVFSAGVEEAFYTFSSGIPRLINLLGDAALLSAFSQQVRPVPPALIEQKAKEMALPERRPAAARR